MSFWSNFAAIFSPTDRGNPAPQDHNPPETEQRNRNLERAGVPIDAENLSALWFTSKAGVLINTETILSIPAFWRAVKILSGVVASLPIEVLQSQEDGSENLLRSHPVSALLNVNPSPLYSRFKFFETLVLHLLAYGNFYAVIQYKVGVPKSLTIVDKPGQVTAELNSRGDLYYNIDNKKYHSDRVIHVSNIAWNGIMGYDLTHLHADNFGLAIANRDYGNRFYANGAHLSGIIKHPGKLTNDAVTRIRRSWEARYSGGDNAGKTAILEEGMDYQQIGLKPGDAQFGETKQITTADISLITGVPRFMLEESDPTFNNGETLTRLFTNFTILPLCESIESELNRKLFFSDEIGVVHVRFNLNQLLRADTEQRGRYIDNLMKWGIINRDEARKMEGWNPIEDGSGQAYYVPMNMMDPTKPQPEAGEQLDLFNQTDDDEDEGNTDTGR